MRIVGVKLYEPLLGLLDARTEVTGGSQANIIREALAEYFGMNPKSTGETYGKQ